VISPSRAVYRTRQVLHALRPRIDAAELAAVHEVLSDDLAALFLAMEKRDQRHALEVVRRLRQDGVDDPDLLAAALLHDCGKGAVPVWLRIVKVLSPALLGRLARPGDAGWRAAAYRLEDHAAIGAAKAEAAGASGLTLRLIAGQVLSEEEPKQALLLRADDAS
jgi:hypothetical protein